MSCGEDISGLVVPPPCGRSPAAGDCGSPSYSPRRMDLMVRSLIAYTGTLAMYSHVADRQELGFLMRSASMTAAYALTPSTTSTVTRGPLAMMLENGGSV